MTTSLISFKNSCTFDHRGERGICNSSAEEHTEFKSLVFRVSVC